MCCPVIISTETPPVSACLPSASAYPGELQHVAARPGSWVMHSEAVPRRKLASKHKYFLSADETPRQQPPRERRPQNQKGEGNTIQLQGIEIRPQRSMLKSNTNNVQTGKHADNPKPRSSHEWNMDVTSTPLVPWMTSLRAAQAAHAVTAMLSVPTGKQQLSHAFHSKPM